MGGGHFFRLTCSVVLWGGRNTTTNVTGVCGECSQWFSHTGCAPAHGLCAFPVYTAQALSCSAGNCLRRALGFVHFPGLSRPGSGTPPRRRLSWACVLCPSQVRAAQVTRCLASSVTATCHLPRPCHSVFWVYSGCTFSGTPCVSSGELISGCDPLGRCRPSKIPRSLG